MSFDGLVLKTVTTELEKLLQGARIDKIHQPTKHKIILALRQRGQNYKLLLSSLAHESRAHLITQAPANPSNPPLFCMVMRKHLEGGRIISITQPGLERIMEMTCEVIDELGDKVFKKIIIEIMGKHSNIILLNPKENLIIDSIQRVPLSISRYRQVLPGLNYISPPPQDKIIPWETEQNLFYEKLLNLPLSTTISKALLKTISGMSPQSVEEIIFRANLASHLTLEYCGEYELSALWQELTKLGSALANGKYTPELIIDNSIPLTFSAFSLTSYPTNLRHDFPNMNEALAYYYSHKTEANHFQQKKADLESLLKKEISRCEKKAGLQLNTILETQNTEQYRLWGELLTANLYNLSQGKEAQVPNYYDPAGKIEVIPLKEHLTVSANAQRYFSRYQKSKNAAIKAQIQLDETNGELEYLYSINNSLSTVTDLLEIEEIREEIREAGYLKVTPTKSKNNVSKKNNVKNKKGIQTPTQPEKIIRDSWTIFYGKNNKQNDLLTMKIAKSEDLWFHTKDIPGSHVIIKNPNGETIPNNILEEAATLAAYNSKARSSINVPVDYTLRKHVWKTKGAKPGQVFYDNQRTIFVTPQDNEK
ncbi:MAG: NFACT RNA binding domain-containing protein [Clostridia bacterium]|nr:NFACT RNA binding domain-containing protein [Clostridia bacterium]MDD4049363.1 NFACT RNA binding domain-containing protein [Clostridia bacterium]